ncbi:PaaI family thioesterase [Marinigracilibium pacificum]|uniref:PaaI family thioesterase n=1 Tax=Marinigracilibium pacificum TaxID=2729599 RepID=A0A848IT32_9BACT|nr:PaaI family thioesterase [Marinigracilibium pacificum]NMM46936.1 PaaI family thioesterase [Marinigracilibium pacificum]
MANPIVQFLNSQIGNTIENTPSEVSNWLKGKLISAEEGKIKISFTIRKEMMNPAGVLHGGMASLIADDMMGMCLFTLNKEHFYTSINLTMDFLKPAFLGDEIVAEAEVIKDGKKITHCVCKLMRDTTVIAYSTSNLMATSKPNGFSQ